MMELFNLVSMGVNGDKMFLVLVSFYAGKLILKRSHVTRILFKWCK